MKGGSITRISWETKSRQAGRSILMASPSQQKHAGPGRKATPKGEGFELGEDREYVEKGYALNR